MKENNTIHKYSDEYLTILDLWHLCLSHWHWFVFSLIVFLGIASFYLFITPDMYTREMAILVKQETQGKNVGQMGKDNDFDDIGLITKNTNVVNVQRQLESLDVLVGVANQVMKPANKREALRIAEDFKRNLKTNIDNDKSTIINIQYSNPSPALAEKVLNAIVQVYNEKWIEDKNQITRSTSQFIEDRLRLLERDLDHVDDSISNFKMRNKITDLERVSDMYLQQQSQSDAEILRVTTQRSMAQYILGILKGKSTRHQLLPTNSGIGNQVAEAQINQYNTMLLQLKSNLVGTSSQNPLIIKQEEELDDIRKNILSTIENQIKTLEIQLGNLQGYNGKANSKIISNPNQAKHLVSVEREQKVKESLYLYLLQKKEENEISMTYSSVNTQVIDMPHGSELPTSPNNRLVLFAAVLFGLLIPVIILFVRESFDKTVRDKSDIEHKTTLSLIGDVPLYSSKKNVGILQQLLHGMSHLSTPLVVRADSQDIVNEAFRYIRTNLEFMTSKHGDNNVYIVTSNYAGSGKTFISTNLALTLAIGGKRVLLIDGDLRHASASHLFHCSNMGLADYLGEKETDLSQLLHHDEDHPNLDILPVGTIPPNPTELLAGNQLSKLFSILRPLYDFILVDCPPSETLADVGIIERHTDRTLFVMRAGLFERKRLNDLEVDSQNGKYKHISLILNATKAGGRYGYHYGYKYGYKYSYNYHKKS